jgi:hypothetical protein
VEETVVGSKLGALRRASVARPVHSPGCCRNHEAAWQNSQPFTWNHSLVIRVSTTLT